MDKQIEELFKKIDKMYYQQKKRAEKDFREEKLNFYKIATKIKEIKREIKETIRKNGKENLILNYEFYMNLHEKLFDEIYPDIAGKSRDIDVGKREEILNGESVKYATSSELKKEGKKFLDDFENKILTAQQEQKKEAFLKSTVELWQKHYFYEGNTRTTALFADFVAMKHDIPLQLVNRDLKEFRNALVLATGKNDWEKLYSFFEENSKTKKVEKEERKARNKKEKEESKEKKTKISKKKKEKDGHER